MKSGITRAYLVVFLLLLIVALACSGSGRNVQSEAALLTAQDPGEDCFKNQESHWTIRLSPDKQRITSLIGGRTKPYLGDVREKVKAFLNETHACFGLKANFDDLKIVDARVSEFSANVELQQVYKDLPVENARVQINFDKEGRVVQVVNSYVPPVLSSDEITISRDKTVKIAATELLRALPIYESQVEEAKRSSGVVKPSDIKVVEPIKMDDVYFSSNGQIHRAFKTYINAKKPFEVKQIVTDARNGAVLQQRDFVFHVDGHGQVFNPNPVATLNDPSLRDYDDSNSAVPPSAYSIVLLQGLEATPGGVYSLKGPFVVIEEIEEPKHLPPTPASPDAFMYQRHDKEFEDVMVYYHIDRIQRYIQSLGFFDVMNTPIRADAHACYGLDQSSYVSTPQTRGHGYLLFGDGAVDDAEDAGVIAHEYGHAIQDNQTLGKYEVTNLETRAMAEGFGDYWAFSTDECPTPHDRACVMAWNFVSIGCRRVDMPRRAPYDTNKTVYENSEIWSGSLYNIFNELGKETADRLVLQSHFNVPSAPSFVDGADSIIAADWQLFKGVNIPKLCKVFQLRGIYGVSDCATAPPPNS